MSVDLYWGARTLLVAKLGAPAADHRLVVFDIDIGNDGHRAQPARDLADILLTQRQAGDGGNGAPIARVRADGPGIKPAIVDHHAAEVLRRPRRRARNAG